MQVAPNVSALRTPDHFFGGCGSRQRRSPTGGWANGIPLKLRTPSLGGTVDSTMPFAVFTRSAPRAGSATAAESMRAGRSVSTDVFMGPSILPDHSTGIRRCCAIGGGSHAGEQARVARRLPRCTTRPGPRADRVSRAQRCSLCGTQHPTAGSCSSLNPADQRPAQGRCVWGPVTLATWLREPPRHQQASGASASGRRRCSSRRT